LPQRLRRRKPLLGAIFFAMIVLLFVLARAPRFQPPPPKAWVIWDRTTANTVARTTAPSAQAGRAAIAPRALMHLSKIPALGTGLLPFLLAVF
jgi:hypothetical protein